MGCNKCCKEDTCVNVRLQDLVELIYLINEEINKNSDRLVNHLFYGYKCKGNEEAVMFRLVCYSDLLSKYYLNINEGLGQCLCDDDIKHVIEKVKDIVSKTRIYGTKCDVVVDKEGVNAWVSENPYCVSREKWEELSYYVCGTIGLSLTMTPQEQCNITFDLIRESINCDVLYAFTVANKTCDLGIEVNRTDSECKIDYKLLQEKTNCDLSYSAYYELITKCNLTYDAIKTATECGIKFNVDDETFTCSTGATYNLSDVDCKSLYDISLLDFINYNGIDREKYLADYALNQQQKENL